MSHAARTPQAVDTMDGPEADQRSAKAPAARAVDLRKVYGSGDTQVAALDGVTVEFCPGQFTAIMGPSGSGKSTLMHCLAALDDATSGQVFVGDADLTTLGDKELTRIRRDRIGFVFQSFNLVPTLTAIENITLPMDIAGRKPDQAMAGHRDQHRRPRRPADPQAQPALRRPAAAGGLCPGAGRPAGHRVRRRADRKPRLGLRRRGARLPAGSVRDFGQTVVMVTHDPNAAGYADRVLFLADGRIVDEMLGADVRTGARPDEELRRQHLSTHPQQPRSPAAAPRTRPGPDMFRATLKSLLAHKLRMGMSAFAIVLGVAFVAGTFVFTDTLNSSFTDLFRQTAPDVTVRPAKAAAAASGGFTGADTRTVPADVVDELATLPTASQRADGNVTDQGTYIIGKDGKVVGSGGGAPGIGGNFNDAPAADGSAIVTITQGRARPARMRW